ncbi:MAG: hypothetical protein ABSF70_13250 [Terracidiphilus sp.]|jgi:hypothetical protein
MPENKPQAKPQVKPPAYVYQVSSPADEFREVARIHHKEAKQLFDSAAVALAEGREQEYKLLTDLANARRERAEEFDRAANGEADDPIVNEILDWQEERNEAFVPHTSNYDGTEGGELPEDWMKELEPPPPGRIARALAWIGSLVTK